MTPAELAPSDPARPSAGGAAPVGAGIPDVPTQPAHASPGDAIHALDALHADQPGPLLAAGTAVDVFAVDDATVLRRYRSGRDAAPEAEILRHVVAHGFPAPAVLGGDGADLLLERLHGPTLLQALAAEEVSLSDGAAILADLHARLHAVPAPDGWGDGAEIPWPRVHGGPTVVHLDLHPGNVILSDTRGPTVVDWSNARTGTAELDVALTALILAEVVVDAGGIYSQAARVLLAAFLGATDVDPTSAVAQAAGLRSLDPSLVPGERDLVPAAAVLVGQLIEIARHPH
jgi:tRNA A-37 threonylcarbamoyl transferase component Bud32